MLNARVSEPEPAAHSPVVAPEAVSVLAAVIASRRVQRPASASLSSVLLTVMVLWTEAAEAVNKRKHPRMSVAKTLGKRCIVIDGLYRF